MSLSSIARWLHSQCWMVTLLFLIVLSFWTVRVETTVSLVVYYSISVALLSKGSTAIMWIICFLTQSARSMETYHLSIFFRYLPNDGTSTVMRKIHLSVLLIYLVFCLNLPIELVHTWYRSLSLFALLAICRDTLMIKTYTLHVTSYKYMHTTTNVETW